MTSVLEIKLRVTFLVIDNILVRWYSNTYKKLFPYKEVYKNL